jgi:hypothetical protein
MRRAASGVGICTKTRSTGGCGLLSSLCYGRRRGGVIRPVLDLECAADFFLATLNTELYLYQRRQLGMDRGRIVAALDSVLNGMRVAGG